MLEIEQKEITKIKNGEFTNIEIDIWFNNNNFNYLNAILEGCQKTKNNQILQLIYIYANYLLENPQIENIDTKTVDNLIISTNFNEKYTQNLTNEEKTKIYSTMLKQQYIKIIKKIIKITAQDEKKYPYIIKDLTNHPNEEIRLYASANGIATNYLNDKSQRVQKIAKIRYKFNQNYQLLSIKEQEQINLITSALQTNAIKYIIIDQNQNIANILIYSTLFNNPWTLKINADLLIIEDKQILAKIIINLIKNNYIELNEKLKIPYFENNPTLKKTI